jgi:hypothetical protein
VGIESNTGRKLRHRGPLHLRCDAAGALTHDVPRALHNTAKGMSAAGDAQTGPTLAPADRQHPTQGSSPAEASQLQLLQMTGPGAPRQQQHQSPQTDRLQEGPRWCWGHRQRRPLRQPQRSRQWRWLSPLLLAGPCRSAQRVLQAPSCQRQNQTQPHGHAGEGQQEPAKPGAPGSRRWLGAQAK